METVETEEMQPSLQKEMEQEEEIIHDVLCEVWKGKKNMKVSDDAKAICRSLDALTKEIKWLGALAEEIQKREQEPAEDKDGAGRKE